MTKEQLLDRLEKAWAALEESYAGLTEARMAEPGVMGEWSVKDILAHVTTWEQEALKMLPLILEGRRPARYSVSFGGIDAFNAIMAEQKRGLSLREITEQLVETHRRLLEYIQNAPEELFTQETPFRRRLRLDSYSHYPIHSRAIRAWRNGRSS